MIWLPSAVSASIATTAVMLIYLMNRRHTYYELARSLHQDLTSGPVAEARAKLGRAYYEGSRNESLSDTEAEEALASCEART